MKNEDKAESRVKDRDGEITRLKAIASERMMLFKQAACQVERLKAELETATLLIFRMQWGFNFSRCPLCAGFDGKSENDKKHSASCPVSRFLARQDSSPANFHEDRT